MSFEIEKRTYADEEQLISILLYDYHKNMPVVDNIVTPDMFSDENLRSVYEALQIEFKNDPQTTLKQALSYHGVNVDLDKIRVMVNDFDFSINQDNDEEVIKIANKVVDHYQARKLINMINTSAQRLSQGAMLDDVKINIEKLFNEMNKDTAKTSVTSLGENFLNFLQEYEIKEEIKRKDPDANLLAGDTTGFKIIDQWTYGLKKQEMWIIAGRPSMGKTALALRMSYLTAKKNNKPALFISLETSEESLTKRLMVMETKIHNSKISEAKLNKEEKKRMINFATTVEDTPLHFLDAVNITPNFIRNVIIQFNERHSEPMRYIFIDYLQLLTPNEKSTMRQEQVSSISRDLKLIAKEFNITVVALAQLSREVEKRPDKRPKMSDLRESGSMEQDADIILLLYRDEYYLSKEEKRPEAQQSLAEIVQAKFKEGATGVYDLSFIPEYMYFSDYINDEV